MFELNEIKGYENRSSAAFYMFNLQKIYTTASTEKLYNCFTNLQQAMSRQDKIILLHDLYLKKICEDDIV